MTVFYCVRAVTVANYETALFGINYSLKWVNILANNNYFNNYAPNSVPWVHFSCGKENGQSCDFTENFHQNFLNPEGFCGNFPKYIAGPLFSLNNVFVHSVYLHWNIYQ
jgi:hypothetical protein